MSKYELIIYWSREDDVFVAEVPELPGCMADGAIYEEAVANAQTAIRKEVGRNGQGDWATHFSAKGTPHVHVK